MITFKQFLLEGGGATSKYGTSRATAADIKAALAFVESTLDLEPGTLKDNLLGSTEVTLLGYKTDSGDIDIALPIAEYNQEEVLAKMIKAVGGEGEFNPGTEVGSYAVPTRDGKKVQVDLMFVSDKKWAKFMYHSSAGYKSKYPGVVRNIILATALARVQEPGKDFVLKRGEQTIARASRSIVPAVGMKRLFKIATAGRDGAYGKNLKTVTPDTLDAFLKAAGEEIPYSRDVDHTADPDEVAQFIFGPGVSAADLLTAEDVIKQIKRMPNATEILSACVKDLDKAKLPVPSELTE